MRPARRASQKELKPRERCQQGGGMAGAVPPAVPVPAAPPRRVPHREEPISLFLAFIRAKVRQSICT